MERPTLYIYESTFGMGGNDHFYKMWMNAKRRREDRMYQALANNSWSNNHGELERWADDGGYQP